MSVQGSSEEVPNHELLEVFSAVVAALPDSQIARLHDIIYHRTNGINAGIMDRFIKGHRQYKYAVQREEKALRQVLAKQNDLESKSMTIIKLRESLAAAEADLERTEAKLRVRERRYDALFRRMWEALDEENTDGQSS